MDELAVSVTREQGKTLADARGDVFRGLGEPPPQTRAAAPGRCPALRPLPWAAPLCSHHPSHPPSLARPLSDSQARSCWPGRGGRGTL
jgi:hypothetical protein